MIAIMISGGVVFLIRGMGKTSAAYVPAWIVKMKNKNLYHFN
jgi:hypothetical protein